MKEIYQWKEWFGELAEKINHKNNREQLVETIQKILNRKEFIKT